MAQDHTHFGVIHFRGLLCCALFSGCRKGEMWVDLLERAATFFRSGKWGGACQECVVAIAHEDDDDEALNSRHPEFLPRAKVRVAIQLAQKPAPMSV